MLAQVAQQTLAATNHLEQPLARGEVVDIFLQMAAELADPITEDRHLHLHGTGVGAVLLMGIDEFLFADRG